MARAFDIETRYPGDLPVVEHRAAIAEAIRAHPVIVVCGETGSGKTTQLPKICLDAGRGRSGMIGHTQPRRIAARRVAERIAEELGVAVGGAVGSKVRFADRTGPDCAIKVMTDGILLAETRSDRQLRAYDTIIIDEAHERSLTIDFLLGYLHRLRAQRPDLRIVITSATIDPQRFSEHFDAAPIIEVSGRTYPVEVRHRPPDGAAGEAMNGAIVAAVQELAAEGPGDVLVFLPGEREIRDAADALRGHRLPRTEILPLYARLSPKEQDRIFRPHDGRRIVLATNVAETSLTVPGIRGVVDTGLARMSRYSARRGVAMLPIEPISRASADQRAGRCGRVGPGVCIRLYGAEDDARRPPFTEPEIQRSNLASVVLAMHDLGLGAVEDFPFLDPPRRAAVREGRRALHELGALDERECITPLGRRLARLPVDPRVGRMILAAEDEGSLAEVLVIAAALSIVDPRDQPLEQRDAARAAQVEFRDQGSDFLGLLRLWEAYHEQRRRLSWRHTERWCRERFVSFRRMREWVDVHGQLRRCAAEARMSVNRAPAGRDAVHRAMLAGLLSHVGRREDDGAFRGAGGIEFRIFPASGLAKKPPRWVMAAELVETTRLWARMVAAIEPRWLETIGAHLLRRSHGEPWWDRERAQAVADETITLYGLPVARRRVPYGRVDRSAARQMFIHHALVLEQWNHDADWCRHNRGVRRALETLEAKLRRRDVLADLAAVEAFWDARVPRDVVDGRTAVRWAKQQERADPARLRLRVEDLLARPPGFDVATAFPDVLEVAGAAAPLRYRYEPGHEADGVTLRVPVAALNQLDPVALDWLVPGLRSEKAIELLRTLPKSLRRSFVPAPEWAAAALDRVEPGGRPMAAALGRALEAMSGVEIPADAWRPEGLPEHLRLRIEAVDDDGAVVAAGRDLAALRRAVGTAAAEAFADAAPAALPEGPHRRWDFGPLPERVQIERAGLRLHGHPAVIDDREAVRVRLLDDAAAAAQAHRAGLRRLVLLELPGAVESAVEARPQREAQRREWAALGAGRDLDDELALLTADRAFLGGDDLPRDAAAFQRRLDAGFPRIMEAALETGALAGAIIAHRQALALELDRPAPEAWAPARSDVAAQIAALVGPGALTATPWDRLVHVPRYLEAALRRLEKLAHGGHLRDRERAERLAPFAAGLEERRRGAPPGDRQVEALRWMLEEYRVSLFAQELGTAVPISPKRLESLLERT